MSDNFSDELDYLLRYNKRRGTTDLAKLYEDYFPAYVILNLLQNQEVSDFRLSTNDERFGAFDDVVLEVEYSNKSTEKYAIQLKHKENLDATIKNFNVDRHFSILNFYRSFQQYTKELSTYKVILLTNAKFEPHDDVVIDLGKDKDNVKVRITECVPSHLINTSKNGKSYQFQLDLENSEEIKQKYKHFFEVFYLYPNQMNVQKLKQKYVADSLRRLTTRSSVTEKFLKFISEWSLIDGTKDKLTKDIIIKVITLYIVEELILPHTFCEVNEKKKLFQRAISHFNITAFETRSLENVVKLWGDAKSILQNCNINEINHIIRRFHISMKDVENIDDLTDQECTKLLWVMDRCPLIIIDHPVAYEAITLCGEKSKFVFITDKLEVEKLKKLTTFKTLSDLKRHTFTYYNNLIKKFTFRLFDETKNLEGLIQENDAFNDLITTDKIAEMTDYLELINLKEELCPSYVKRHLYRNIIDAKYLQKLDENTLVLISNVSDEKKLRDGFQNFEIVSITNELCEDTDDISNNILSKKYKQLCNTLEFENHIQNLEDVCINEATDELQNNPNITKNRKQFGISQDGSTKKYRLFINKTEASTEKFFKLCTTRKKYQKFHHLRYHNKHFEWIESIGDVSDLQMFTIRSDSLVSQEEIYTENIRNNLNIIIGDPGMGKSMFVRKLKNKLLSKYLTIIIQPTDVPELCLCLERLETVQQFFSCILEMKFPNFENFEKQVLKLILENRRTVCMWDALDELSEQNRVLVEKQILTLRKSSVVQFLTSRKFLRKQLEDKFNVLCQELQPFNDEQQTDYIQRRLQDICYGEKLESITSAILADTSYNDILEIPLQIHMLTELFRQNIQKYNNLLSQFFVITDLYFHSIEEKFNFYFEKKQKFSCNYKEDVFIKRSVSRRIRNYQQVALKSIFGTTFSTKADIEYEIFLEEIKNGGDEFGLIALDINMQPEFLHKSYAEYFAAVYLAENCRYISNFDFIFDRKYTNLKYFFDLLLAKNSPVHIAVLCKNLRYLQDHNGKDELKTKDLQGRSALHLAASCGARYPLLETIDDDSQQLTELRNSILGSSIVINDNINYETKKENVQYQQIMDILLDNCNPNEIDELFKITPTMYAEKCECLFAAALIEKKTKNESFLKLKNEPHIYSLLYYAVKYEFIDVVDLFVDLKFMIIRNGDSILHIAATNNQFEYINKILSHELYRQNINYRNLLGETALMIAARNGSIETVQHLLRMNAKIDDADNYGFTPLMVAVQNRHLDTVKYLKEHNAKLTAVASNGQTPLYLAAGNGHLEIVKYLIKENVNVNVVDEDGETPLLSAAYNGHLETVKYLMQVNANINAVNSKGWTLLHSTAHKGHFDTVEYLIQKNVNVNAVDNDGWTPLHLAARNGHLESVRYLIQNHANVNAVENAGWTPLHLAVDNEHLETVKYLIQEHANVNAVDHDGWTPLHLAAGNRHFETVEYLVKEHAEVNAVNNNGRAPVHQAALNGHLETVRYLLQQHANVNTVDNDGWTLLHLVAQNGHLGTVKYLIQEQANVDAVSNNGRTPVHQAALNGHLETMKYLIQEHANVNAVDNEGWTPLHLAAQNRHLEVVKYLIEEHANVNAINNDGWTPLHLAAHSRHLESVKYLIQNYANVNAVENDGWTPLHLAANNGHLDTVKYLIQEHANVNVVNNDGWTPLHLAADNRHLETVKYLIMEQANLTSQ